MNDETNESLYFILFLKKKRKPSLGTGKLKKKAHDHILLTE